MNRRNCCDNCCNGCCNNNPCCCSENQPFFGNPCIVCPEGRQGPPGVRGPIGPVGPAGPQGIQGETGPVGPAGPQGIQGETGPVGPVGPAGPQGIQGETGPVGPAGPQGIQGETGPVGPAGPQGIQGETGPVGPAGPQGIQGETGPVGPAGPQGIQGETGPVGPAGPQGIQGETGPAGGVLSFADFYALMPPDNAATVAPGTDVSFPQDGPNSGADITRLGADSFELGPIGTYQILFQVSVTEAGQLILTLNGEDLPYTVAGRATGTSQIVGMALVETTTENSVLTVRNPEGTAAALTITPLAGGVRPVSAHLVIMQIQ
ncbi:MAG: collagen-like protein [Clostridia bacterium]|nr:collagen-like protein [Clostridia bacterium]